MLVADFDSMRCDLQIGQCIVSTSAPVCDHSCRDWLAAQFCGVREKLTFLCLLLVNLIEDICSCCLELEFYDNFSSILHSEISVCLSMYITT